MQPKISAGVLISLALSGTACQPDTITEARDQLARGGTRTFSISVPITSDTLTIAQLLPEDDTITTTGGLIGVPVDSQSVTVSVGDQLEFTGINFDAFSFGYDQMLTTTEESVTVAVVAPSPPALSGPFQAPPANGVGFDTDNGSSVQSATIGSGWLVREVTNGTSCSGTVAVTAVDSLNNSVVVFPDIAVGPSQTVVDSVDASGATMVGFVVIDAGITPAGFCIPVSGETVATKIVFRPLTMASVTLANLNEPFSSNYGALNSEGRVQAVDTIVVNSGSFTITAENRLPVDLNFDIALAGIFKNGVIESASFVVPAAPGDGSTVTAAVVFDLAGDTIVPSEVLATVNGSVTASTATITSALVANAVVVNASGNVVVETLIGTLDPAQTPELTVNVKDFVEVSSADFDFDEFEDAIRDATIRSTDAFLTVVNSSGVALTLDNFVLSVSRIDPATGQPVVDAGGDFVLETDSTGAPLQVVVAPTGSTVFAVPQQSSRSITLELARVANRIVNLALDGVPVALVATGAAVAGDASSARIDRADDIEVAVKLVIGLDVTIPTGGLRVQLNNQESGAEFDPQDADDIARHVVSAGLTSTIVNGTPFALLVEVAYVEGDRGADFDAFSAPDRVEITPVSIDAPTVGPFGRVVTPVASGVELVLTGGQIRQLLGDFISSSIRITLLPGPGGGGRAAVRPTDEVLVELGATLEIQGGN